MSIFVNNNEIDNQISLCLKEKECLVALNTNDKLIYYIENVIDLNDFTYIIKKAYKNYDDLKIEYISAQELKDKEFLKEGCIYVLKEKLKDINLESLKNIYDIKHLYNKGYITKDLSENTKDTLYKSTTFLCVEVLKEINIKNLSIERFNIFNHFLSGLTSIISTFNIILNKSSIDEICSKIYPNENESLKIDYNYVYKKVLVNYIDKNNLEELYYFTDKFIKNKSENERVDFFTGLLKENSLKISLYINEHKKEYKDLLLDVNLELIDKFNKIFVNDKKSVINKKIYSASFLIDLNKLEKYMCKNIKNIELDFLKVEATRFFKSFPEERTRVRFFNEMFVIELIIEDIKPVVENIDERVNDFYEYINFLGEKYDDGKMLMSKRDESIDYLKEYRLLKMIDEKDVNFSKKKC